jgi:hypothetical protein
MYFFILALVILGAYLSIRWADLAITTSQVAPGANTNQQTANAAVTITAGQSVYKDASGNIQLGQNDTLVHAAVNGVAVNNAAANQPVTYQIGGTVTLGAGAAVAVGTIYCQSQNAGKIAPWADLGTNNYVTIIGVGATSSTLAMPGSGPYATGILHA